PSYLSLTLLSTSRPTLLLFTLDAPAPTAIYTLSLHDALPIFKLTEGLKEVARDNGFDLRVTGEPAMFYLRLGNDFPSTILHQERSEEHTSELQSRFDLVCRLLLEKKNTIITCIHRHRRSLRK